VRGVTAWGVLGTTQAAQVCRVLLATALMALNVHDGNGLQVGAVAAVRAYARVVAAVGHPSASGKRLARLVLGYSALVLRRAGGATSVVNRAGMPFPPLRGPLGGTLARGM
jgi:hypothetical protein